MELVKTKSLHAKVATVDETLGIVFGWGIVSTVKGERYFDLQGDHIPDDSMMKATSDFMIESRVAGDMHEVIGVGQIVHSFPLTAELAKAFGIECDQTGWLVGYKPDDAAILQKFVDGTYTGFSIGGERILDEAA